MQGNGLKEVETSTFDGFQYDKIINFNYMNFTIAIKNGKAGLIDINGKPLTDFIYDDLTDYYGKDEDNAGWMVYEDDYCVMRLNGKWGVLNYNCKVIIDFQYDDEITTYSVEDKIIVVQNGNYSLIDINGNLITNEYDTIMPQINGYACVTLGDDVGIINSNGELVIDCKYQWVEVSNSSYFAVKTHDDFWGVVDTTQKVILDFKYDNINICNSKDGKNVVFVAELDNKSALFNTTGERIT